MTTEPRRKKMEEAFEALEHVHSTDEDWGPGMMGDQLTLFLTGTDEPDFNLYVEDVGLNCEWNIVKLSSGRFRPDVPDEADMVADVEVRRFPEVEDDE